MSKEVDDYIEKQKSPRKEICQKLSKIILETFPGIKEEMKLGVPWYEDKYYIFEILPRLKFSLLKEGQL